MGDANSPWSIHWLAGHSGTRRRPVPAPVGRSGERRPILRPRRSKSQSFRDDAFDDPSPHAVHRSRLLIYERRVCAISPVPGVQYLPALVQLVASRSLLVLSSKLTLEQRNARQVRRADTPCPSSPIAIATQLLTSHGVVSTASQPVGQHNSHFMLVRELFIVAYTLPGIICLDEFLRSVGFISHS